MKKLIIIGLFILMTVSSYAQLNTENISFEFRYPVPIGDNYISKAFDNGYLGLIDVGVDYNIINTNGLGMGILFNSSVLRLSETDVTLWVLSPKIKVEYEIDLNRLSIIPQVGVGYSNWRFRAPEVTYTNQFGEVQEEEFMINNNGLTVKGASKLVLNNDKNLKWYLNISYEFTKLENTERKSDTKYSRNLHLFYPGIGMIWNFGG